MPHPIGSSRLRRAALAAMILALARSLAGRLRRVGVRGESMTPTLRPGDSVVVFRTARVPPVGWIVVVRDRFDDRLRIKRLADGSGPGLVLIGDNTVLSTDSRSEGAFAPEQLLGVAILRLRPGAAPRPLMYARQP